MRHVRSGKNTRCIFFPLAPKVWEIGDQKGLHGSEDRYIPANQIWLWCDWSIVVGCRSRNDWQTSRQTDKQNGMTIGLTLCERDTKIDHHSYLLFSFSASKTLLSFLQFVLHISSILQASAVNNRCMAFCFIACWNSWVILHGLETSL